MASKVLRELTIKLDADIAELKKDLSKAQKQLGGFQKKVNGIGKSIKNAFSVVAIVAVGRQAAVLASEMSDLGKELEGVQNGFKGIDPTILDEMRVATHGTVTDLELMKNAVQAKNFGLPLKDMGTMLEFVHRRARASGESVAFLTQSLVTGLGRKSKMIIDNLGISASQLNDQLKLTPDFTTAVAEIMEKDMASAGEYIETAADITDRWAASWENTKANVGLFINKGIKLIAPVIDDLKKNFSEFFKNVGPQMVSFINEWITLYNESIVFRALIVGLKTNFKIMWITFKGSVNLMIDAIKGLGKIIFFTLKPSNWGRGFTEGIENIIRGSAKEIKDDALKMGKELGEVAYDGITSITNGKKDLITIDKLLPVETLKKDAKDLGKDIGQGIRSGIDLVPTVQSKSITGIKQDAPIIDTSKISTAGSEISTVTEQIKIDMASVNNFLADSFTQLGENLGNSFSGMGSMFDGMLNIVLDFASQFGKILIGLGVAAISLKTLGINPVAAVIAGVAIVALSKAARNMLGDGPKFAGGGIIPGNSFAHDRVPIMANSSEMVLNNGQQSNLFRQLNNGGNSQSGGQLTAVVAGSDLKFILDEANRQNNNSF